MSLWGWSFWHCTSHKDDAFHKQSKLATRWFNRLQDVVSHLYQHLFVTFFVYVWDMAWISQEPVGSLQDLCFMFVFLTFHGCQRRSGSCGHWSLHLPLLGVPSHGWVRWSGEAAKRCLPRMMEGFLGTSQRVWTNLADFRFCDWHLPLVL